jgi:hypothetical protein
MEKIGIRKRESHIHQVTLVCNNSVYDGCHKKLPLKKKKKPCLVCAVGESRIIRPAQEFLQQDISKSTTSANKTVQDLMSQNVADPFQ